MPIQSKYQFPRFSAANRNPAFPRFTRLAALLAAAFLVSSAAANTVTSWGRQVLPPPEEIDTLMDVAAGQDFNIAIRPGGKVVGWGSNNFRQVTIPEDLSASMVAAGATHVVALSRDGEVFAWGGNRYGQTDVPEDLSEVTAVAAGERHTLALRADGTVVAWGDNRHGQTAVPQGLTDVSAIAAGLHHSLALLRDGTVVAWGRNDEGQTAVPEDLTNAVAVSGGRAHSLALLRDGSVIGWGNNSFGQSDAPAEARGITRIASGEDHNLALRDDGTVLAWGRNHYGQTTLPEQINDGRRIAAGAFHNLVLRENGSVIGWGNNDNGQTVDPAELASVIEISAWESHTVALKSDGTVVSWGAILETGVAPNRERLQNIVAVAAGRAHGLALRDDGTVVAWGDDFYRQATPPPSLDNVVAIAAGEFHSLALRANGTVVAWGNNYQGQIDVPQNLNNVMAISAGQLHSLALRSDGTVIGWGHNFYGQTSVPADLTDVIAIAAGSYHSLALKRDGSVVGWGSNLFGQISVPVWLSDAVAIEASSSHSAAIRENRQIAIWGSNYYGQATPPGNLRNVVDIAVGAARTLTVQGNLQPPVIVSPLPSGIVSAGRDVTLVPFLRGSKPMIFQWMRDGRPLPDEKGKALTLETVSADSSGTYSVIVANPVGNTRSPNSNIEVEDPTIRIEVAPAVAVIGETAILSANAAGTPPLEFRWLKNGEPIDAPPGDTLIIEQVSDDDTGIYTAEVSNRFGSATSNEIDFYIAPQIQQQPPALATARIGERLTLAISASGSPPISIQWRKNGADIPDATEPELVLENIRVDDGGVYTAHVSNPAGRVVSEPIQLQIAPHIVLQPEAQIFSGFGGAAVFEVRAIGTQPLVYRWMKDGKLLAETEQPRLALERVQATEAGQYHVVVVNAAGQAESEPARLVLPPAIATHPRSQTARAGDSVEFSASAAGSPPLRYQWLKDGQPIEGATSQTLRIDPVEGGDTGRYSVAAANEVGEAVSEAAMLAVSPTILDSPEPTAVMAGTTLTLAVTAEGSSPLYFQWVKDGEVIQEALDPVLTIYNASPEDAGNYSVVVSNSVGIAVSDHAAVEIRPNGQYGTPPGR